MQKKVVLKKCLKCNAMVEVIKPCLCKDCSFTCCGEPMQDVSENFKDFSFEKHVPTYKIKEDKIVVSVNHVMEPEHFIEWIAIKNEEEKHIKYLKPNTQAVVEFDLIENAVLYAYCNIHGLWSAKVE